MKVEEADVRLLRWILNDPQSLEAVLVLVKKKRALVNGKKRHADEGWRKKKRKKSNVPR